MLQRIRMKTRILLILFGIVALFAVMALFNVNPVGKIRDLGAEATAKVMMDD